MDGKRLLTILKDWHICPVSGLDIDECESRTPDCKHKVWEQETPMVAADLIIHHVPSDRFILTSRMKEPLGWAIPGGFVDAGKETAIEAAVREAAEEVGVKVTNVRQFHTYSHPGRDPRGHNAAIVYTADTLDTPKALDETAEIGWFDPRTCKVYREDGKTVAANGTLCFDHAQILMELLHFFKTGERPTRE